MINSTIELPKITADLPAPVLANPLLPALPLSETYMMDCIAGMKEYPDKWFDLAIVDPPYGIGETGERSNRPHKTKKCKNPNGAISNYTVKEWDVKPPPLEYFYELFRCSKNQIIWGANHFISRMPYDSPGWIVWDKLTGDNDFADCELAFSSFDKAVRKVELLWNGFQRCEVVKRIHPTQKPLKLYDWVFTKYAQEGQRILDTHLGSGSSRIAAHKNKLNFVGFEIDKEYFDKQEKRFANYVCQPRLF